MLFSENLLDRVVQVPTGEQCQVVAVFVVQEDGYQPVPQQNTTYPYSYTPQSYPSFSLPVKISVVKLVVIYPDGRLSTINADNLYVVKEESCPN